MAVTVFNPFDNFLAANQQFQSGVQSLGNARRNRKSLELQEEQLDESKLSGVSNRAQQEALTEQASATAATTRMKNKVLKSLPKETLQGIYTNEAAANKAQIFNLNSQISNMAKLQALETAKLTQGADVAIKNANAQVAQVKASSAQVMQAFDEQNKTLTIEKQQRDQRLADFNDVVKGMDVAGANAAREAFMQNKPLNEIGEIGLAADQESSAALAETKRASDIATKKATTKSLQKSPAAQKREAKGFGDGTFARRQDAEANAQPTQPTIKIAFDKTPGRFAIGGKGESGKGFNIDYPEAVELGKEQEWLDGYEETFGEPYDIPENQKSDLDKANGSKTSEVKPPADIVKLRDEQFPGAEIVFRDGKWGVVQ